MKLYDVLEKFGENTVKGAKASLEKHKKINTGTLYKSIKSKIVQGDGYLDVEFYNEDYGTWVNYGRLAGSKQPPIGNIMLWCVQNGINTSAAYVIARAIAKRGIKPTYFYTSSIDINEKTMDIDLLSVDILYLDDDIENILDSLDAELKNNK